MSVFTTSTGEVVVLKQGDTVEVAQGDESMTGPLIEYSGLLFVGKSGRSMDYYVRCGFTVDVLERAF